MNSVKCNQSKNFDPHVFTHEFHPEQRVFTFVHLSDFHLFYSDNVRLRELLNKRIYGYLSWYLHRRREHSDEILKSLIEDMHSARPDHMVITGDLTHLGRPEEFVMAEQLLRSLGPPSKVTVIPGNHDTYIKTSWEQTFRLWLPYMASDADGHNIPEAEKALHSTFPILRVRKGVALIGVSTAKPTPPFFATGSIGRKQLERLEDILIETKRSGLLRFILIHHPPIPGVTSRRKCLTDQADFQSLIELHGADLILYGHTHHTSSGYLKTPHGRVLSLGVPSATALGRTASRRARYHLFTLIQTKDRRELFISVRIYSSARSGFVDESVRQILLPINFDGCCT